MCCINMAPYIEQKEKSPTSIIPSLQCQIGIQVFKLQIVKMAFLVPIDTCTFLPAMKGVTWMTHTFIIGTNELNALTNSMYTVM